MRREIFNANNVCRHYTLFVWNECNFCKQEFRREKGYRWAFGSRVWHYSCGTCSASIGHCNDQIQHKKDRRFAMSKGLIPPAPPLKSYRNY